MKPFVITASFILYPPKNCPDYCNEERDINKEIKQVDLANGEEARLQGEIVFENVLKSQRKHKFSGNHMVFDLNRRCDGFPIGSQKDGALLVSVITPLADDYELIDKGKAILESGAEGGYVLIRLGNDESLGRELRTYLQTEKYVARKKGFEVQRDENVR